MNESVGKIITGIVTDKNEKAVFVQKAGVTYRLVAEDLSLYQLGDAVEGFAYVGKDGRYKLTPELPKSMIGRYGWGEVVRSRTDLGVFVDIGLPDKDVVVSMDDLPNEKDIWPKKGDRLLISLSVDDQERMWGKLADDSIFDGLARKAGKEMRNKDIAGTVYHPKLVGTYVFTDEGYLGFVHPSEREREPRLGEVVKGRVIDVKEDGTLNLSLMPRAYEVLEDDAAMILEVVKRSKENRIPYTDKSSPEDIKKQFGISKAQFKRSLGRLMKQKLVRQEAGYTILNEQPQEEKDNSNS